MIILTSLTYQNKFGNLVDSAKFQMFAYTGF